MSIRDDHHCAALKSAYDNIMADELPLDFVKISNLILAVGAVVYPPRSQDDFFDPEPFDVEKANMDQRLKEAKKPTITD